MQRLLAVPLFAVVACGGPAEIDPDSLRASAYVAVTHADGRFVAVSGAGDYHGESPEPNARIATSVGGDVWTVSFLEEHGTLSAVTRGAGQWVAVGQGSFAGSTVLLSSDGETWRGATAPPPPPMSGVAFGNGVYVASGMYGAQVYVSPDGETWTQVLVDALWDYPQVAFVAGRFVVAGSGSTIAESTDGLDWTLTELPLTHITDIVERDGAAFAVGLVDDSGGQRIDLARSVVIEGPGTWTVRERAGAPLIELALAGDTVVASTFDDLVRGPDIEGGAGALTVVSPGPGYGLAADGATVVAAGGDDLRVSHDAGATWTVAVAPDE